MTGNVTGPAASNIVDHISRPNSTVNVAGVALPIAAQSVGLGSTSGTRGGNVTIQGGKGATTPDGGEVSIEDGSSAFQAIVGPSSVFMQQTGGDVIVAVSASLIEAFILGAGATGQVTVEPAIVQGIAIDGSGNQTTLTVEAALGSLSIAPSNGTHQAACAVTQSGGNCSAVLEAFVTSGSSSQLTLADSATASLVCNDGTGNEGVLFSSITGAGASAQNAAATQQAAVSAGIVGSIAQVTALTVASGGVTNTLTVGAAFGTETAITAVQGSNEGQLNIATSTAGLSVTQSGGVSSTMVVSQTAVTSTNTDGAGNEAVMGTTVSGGLATVAMAAGSSAGQTSITIAEDALGGSATVTTVDPAGTFLNIISYTGSGAVPAGCSATHQLYAAARSINSSGGSLVVTIPLILPGSGILVSQARFEIRSQFKCTAAGSGPASPAPAVGDGLSAKWYATWMNNNGAVGALGAPPLGCTLDGVAANSDSFPFSTNPSSHATMQVNAGGTNSVVFNFFAYCLTGNSLGTVFAELFIDVWLN